MFLTLSCILDHEIYQIYHICGVYVTSRPKEMRNEMKSHKWEKEKLDCIDDIRRYIRIVSFVSSFILKCQQNVENLLHDPRIESPG